MIDWLHRSVIGRGETDQSETRLSLDINPFSSFRASAQGNSIGVTTVLSRGIGWHVHFSFMIMNLI